MRREESTIRHRVDSRIMIDVVKKCSYGLWTCTDRNSKLSDDYDILLKVDRCNSQVNQMKAVKTERGIDPSIRLRLYRHTFITSTGWKFWDAGKVPKWKFAWHTVEWRPLTSGKWRWYKCRWFKGLELVHHLHIRALDVFRFNRLDADLWFMPVI